MKLFRLIFTIALIIPILSCKAQSQKNEVKSNSVASSEKIEAYYFHFTTRCTTCRTIEENAKLNLETLYPDMIKNGTMSFQSVNLDDASSESLASELGVSGQTLLLVKGNKKINLTNEGFMYAVVKPEKFREVIKEKVDSLLK